MMHIKRFATSLAILQLLIIYVSSNIHAFPEYRGGAERAGYSAGCSLDPDAMGHVYTANVSAAGVNLSQPVSDGGYAYVGTHSGRIIKIDLATGEVLPQFVQTGGAVTATGLLRDGMLYIGSTDGYMYFINTSTMETAHRFKVSASISTAPVYITLPPYNDRIMIADDNIFFFRICL
jgi:outer membrane protein assembly factor BamB